MKVLSTDIDEVYDDIIEEIGIDNFIKICRLRGGMSVYIPKYSCVTRLSRNRDIVKRINGVNFESIAMEYRLSVSYVRRILKREGVL